MLGTGAQTIQYFVPTLIGALGWTGPVGQYHTIPLYACAFVFILAAAWGSDHYQNKPMFISGLALFGTVCFIICVASTNHMVQYVFIIFGLGCIYATCPLILIWVSNSILLQARPLINRSPMSLVSQLRNEQLPSHSLTVWEIALPSMVFSYGPRPMLLDTFPDSRQLLSSWVVSSSSLRSWLSSSRNTPMRMLIPMRLLLGRLRGRGNKGYRSQRQSRLRLRFMCWY